MRPLITLCMIVKNEEAILARCVREARRLYDRYVIVDTGSTDATEAVAKEALAGIGVEGIFTHRPWKGFGRSKTDALDIARDAFGSAPNHYALVLDADEIVRGDWPEELGKFDRYQLWMQLNNVRYPNTRIFRMSIPWRYVGVRHEFPMAANGYPASEYLLPGMTITTPRDGARGKEPDTYATDAKEIEAELVRGDFEIPGLETRYRFYLAQSYRDAGNLEAAVTNYRARAAMGGGLNYEEIYISHLQAGRCLTRLGRHPEANQAFLDAHHAYPARSEAIRELAVRFESARAKHDVSPPTGSLFVEMAPGQPLSPKDPYRLLNKPLSDSAAEAEPGTLAHLFYHHKGRPIDKWVHYLPVYERHLRRERLPKVPRVLEIGVQRGGSLQMWRAWFGQSAILHGLDIDPNCKDRADPPTVIHIGSQADTEILARIVTDMGGVDVVIDDGSHVNSDQIVTFETLYPLLSPHGVYICEDIHTSYWSAGYEGGWEKEGTFVEFVKNKIDELHAWYAEDDRDEGFARMTGSIHVYDSIVVIEKEPKDEPKRSVVGDPEPEPAAVSVPTSEES